MSAFLRICFILNVIAMTLVLVSMMMAMQAFVVNYRSPFLVAHVVLGILTFRNLRQFSVDDPDEVLLDEEPVFEQPDRLPNRKLLIAYSVALGFQIAAMVVIIVESFVTVINQTPGGGAQGDVSRLLNSSYFLAIVILAGLGFCAFLYVLGVLRGRDESVEDEEELEF